MHRDKKKWTSKLLTALYVYSGSAKFPFEAPTSNEVALAYAQIAFSIHALHVHNFRTKQIWRFFFLLFLWQNIHVFFPLTSFNIFFFLVNAYIEKINYLAVAWKPVFMRSACFVWRCGIRAFVIHSAAGAGVARVDGSVCVCASTVRIWAPLWHAAPHVGLRIN